MDELSDTPVWKLQCSYYGWMFIRNVSDPLSYRACHDRIWIQTKSIGNTFQLTHSGGNFVRLRELDSSTAGI